MDLKCFESYCECCDEPCLPMTIRFEMGEAILYGNPHETEDSYIVSGCCSYKVVSKLIQLNNDKSLTVTVTNV